MKIVRILIYEGPEEWIEKTMEKSLKLGITEVGPGRTITVKDATEVLKEFGEFNLYDSSLISSVVDKDDTKEA